MKKRRKSKQARTIQCRLGKTREVTLSCAVNMSAQPEGRKGPPTISMRAYTGVPMNIRGFDLPIVVDLRGLDIGTKSRPLLKDHRASQVVGHTTAIQNDGKSVHATGVISGTGAAAKQVAEAGLNGFPWQASITASIRRLDRIARGKSADVNGRNVLGPAYIARASVLKEISIVALGADDDTTAAIAAQRKETANMNFKAWLKKRGFNFDDLTATQRKSLKASWQAEMTLKAKSKVPAGGAEDDAADDDAADVEAGDEDAADDDAADADDLEASDEDGDDAEDSDEDDGDVEASDEDATDDEPKKGDKTKKVVRASGLTQADLQAALKDERTRQARIMKLPGIKNHPELLASAIEKNWSAGKTELRLLRATRGARPDVNPRRGGKAMETQAKIVECALCLAGGLSAENAEQHFDDRTIEAAMSQKHRGAGIQELMYGTVQAAGGHIKAGRIGNAEIRETFEADRKLRASAPGFSTVGLTGILGNVAEKLLLDAWGSVDSALPEIAATANVNNFKLHYGYRLDLSGGFTKVGQDGELKHVSLKETEFTNQLATYGSILALTRQMMIDDDMGAFSAIPRMLGRAGALRREEVVMELILSNPSTFWGTGNNNYIEGATTVLSINGLTQAVTKFRKQVDANSKPIKLAPKKLLVPPELEALAGIINTAMTVNEASTAGATTANDNPHKAKYKPVVSEYLSNSAYSGYSTTAWFLMADPKDAASIEVAYLRGQQTPTIEQGEPSFDTLGIAWRSYHDFGAAMRDKQASVKSKGTA